MPMVAPPTWRESNQPSLQETQGGSKACTYNSFQVQMPGGCGRPLTATHDQKVPPIAANLSLPIHYCLPVLLSMCC